MNAAEPPAEPSEPAAPWQPLTFRGAARFAEAGWGRLLLVEVAAAAIVALTVVWFLQENYAPVIAQAAQKMPDGAKIKAGRLTGVSETLLSETKLIAIAVTPEDSTDIGQSADVQVQFRSTNFRAGSAYRPDWGCQVDYDARTIDVSRSALEPLWGAWHPVVLAGCGVATGVALLVSWTALGLIYALPAWLGAWFSDRRLSLAGAWKLCSASLLPASLLVALGVFLYGIQAIDLIGLGCFYAGHFVLGWTYVAGAVVFLEESGPRPAENPFA
ncbi:MAG TPA: hypothetical protein VHB20_10495 [Verrucomicrobiae bacterium]|jgi:hypothetical protein|nr:hypothetical protein [Verrucomicrobiae bacterium]